MLGLPGERLLRLGGRPKEESYFYHWKKSGLCSIFGTCKNLNLYILFVVKSLLTGDMFKNRMGSAWQVKD